VRQAKTDRNGKILKLNAAGKTAAEIAGRFKMTPEAVRAVLWRAVPDKRNRKPLPIGPDPGKVCRLLTDPLSGVADSQVDLAEKLSKWALAQSLQPVSLATIKLWSSPKWAGRPAPTRKFSKRAAPFEVLLKFAKAHGVALPE
jgi:hypothetical protein